MKNAYKGTPKRAQHCKKVISKGCLARGLDSSSKKALNLDRRDTLRRVIACTAAKVTLFHSSSKKFPKRYQQMIKMEAQGRWTKCSKNDRCLGTLCLQNRPQCALIIVQNRCLGSDLWPQRAPGGSGRLWRVILDRVLLVCYRFLDCFQTVLCNGFFIVSDRHAHVIFFCSLGSGRWFCVGSRSTFWLCSVLLLLSGPAGLCRSRPGAK